MALTNGEKSAEQAPVQLEGGTSGSSRPEGLDRAAAQIWGPESVGEIKTAGMGGWFSKKAPEASFPAETCTVQMSQRPLDPYDRYSFSCTNWGQSGVIEQGGSPKSKFFRLQSEKGDQRTTEIESRTPLSWVGGSTFNVNDVRSKEKLASVTMTPGADGSRTYQIYDKRNTMVATSSRIDGGDYRINGANGKPLANVSKSWFNIPYLYPARWTISSEQNSPVDPRVFMALHAMQMRHGR